MIKYIEIVCKECNKGFVYIRILPIYFDRCNWTITQFIPCPWCDCINYKRFGYSIGKGFINDTI